MKTLKTALVGLGRVGWRFHLPNIVAKEGFELCAVVDVSDERLEEAKEEYGARGYHDINTMLENEHPQLVVIASPTHLHKEHALAALKSGADVFLDKPMANTYEDACLIAETAKKLSRKIMIYQPHRGTPELTALRNIINSGKLGEIYMVKRSISLYSRRNDWQTLKKFGGGMINNYGSHLIDQMLHLLQDTPESHYCRCRQIATFGDTEDVVKIVMQMKGGAIVDIDINCAAAYPITKWMAFGKYGTAVYEGPDEIGCFNIKYFDPTAVKDLEVNECLTAVGRMYSHDQPLPWVEETINVSEKDKLNFYDKCYEYFAENKSPFVPVEETLGVMKFIDQLHKEQE